MEEEEVVQEEQGGEEEGGRGQGSERYMPRKGISYRHFTYVVSPASHHLKFGSLSLSHVPAPMSAPATCCSTRPQPDLGVFQTFKKDDQKLCLLRGLGAEQNWTPSCILVHTSECQHTVSFQPGWEPFWTHGLG